MNVSHLIVFEKKRALVLKELSGGGAIL